MKASGPITSWEIDGETVETVSGFICLGSKITADGDCSHEIKSGNLIPKWRTHNIYPIPTESIFAINQIFCLFQTPD